MAYIQENNSLVGNEDRTSKSDVFSRGITCTRLFETTRKLRGRKIVLLAFTGGLFAIGLLVLIVVSNSHSDRLNRVIPNQLWYKEPVYEIITESIKDTSPKAGDGLRKEGQGVGDIRG